MSTEGNFAKLNMMNAIKKLEIEIQNNKLTHAYLFVGGGKAEKEAIIQFFSSKKECFPEDISAISPEEALGRAGEIKIEPIRELLHTIYLSPNGPARLAIINNCEKLNQSSGNVLLKSLEEPPSYLTFLLFAENDSVLSTIRSRCRIMHLAELDEAEENEIKSLGSLFGTGFFEASAKIEKIIKDEQVKEFIEDIGKYLRKKMISTKNINYAKALDDLEETKKQIGSNSNVRLVLECLYLKLKEIK